jgi:hypothetical protein
MFHENVYFLKWTRLIYVAALYYLAFYHLQIFISYKGQQMLAEPTLIYRVTLSDFNNSVLGILFNINDSAARSKAWVRGRSLVGIACSNRTRDMDAWFS